MDQQEIKDKILDNVTIDDETGCWVWNRATIKSGYGFISTGIGKQTYVHRTSYEVFKGKIPEGLIIMHACDNPPCCNPDHLSAGTQKENMQDCARKGRLGNPFTSEQVRGENNIKAKLKTEQVIEIFKSTDRTADLAEKYGVTQALIYAIKRGKIWQHVTDTL